jgi:hypothetical protein
MGGIPTLKEFVDAMSVGWPIAMSVFVACTGLLAADYWQIVYFANAPAWGLTLLFVVAEVGGLIPLGSTSFSSDDPRTAGLRRSCTVTWNVPSPT